LGMQGLLLYNRDSCRLWFSLRYIDSGDAGLDTSYQRFDITGTYEYAFDTMTHIDNYGNLHYYKYGHFDILDFNDPTQAVRVTEQRLSCDTRSQRMRFTIRDTNYMAVYKFIE